MEKQKLPVGWDAKRIKDVLDHYENQTEDEEAAEIEFALKTLRSAPGGDFGEPQTGPPRT